MRIAYRFRGRPAVESLVLGLDGPADRRYKGELDGSFGARRRVHAHEDQ